MRFERVGFAQAAAPERPPHEEESMSTVTARCGTASARNLAGRSSAELLGVDRL
jgi:hypothetical protein